MGADLVSNGAMPNWFCDLLRDFCVFGVFHLPPLSEAFGTKQQSAEGAEPSQEIAECASGNPT